MAINSALKQQYYYVQHNGKKMLAVLPFTQTVATTATQQSPGYTTIAGYIQPAKKFRYHPYINFNRREHSRVCCLGDWSADSSKTQVGSLGVSDKHMAAIIPISSESVVAIKYNLSTVHKFYDVSTKLTVSDSVNSIH